MADPKKRKSSSTRARRRRGGESACATEAGRAAQAVGLQLQSYQIGGLPLINHVLQRMQLERWLGEHLPPDDGRCEFPTVSSVMVLVRNVLMSREPVYGVGEWAGLLAPDLLNLWSDDLPLLNDDRLGRALGRLFAGAGPELVLAVVRHVVREFDLTLDELHNDSTTVSFHGTYDDAAEEGVRLGRSTVAITWGHSKARRPDLKQLLYTLTITDDGGVPVYFTTDSGNQVDDKTHCATWDLLCQLVGRPDFLYVADCKLASAENLAYIADRQGRFITVMPRTHGEDRQFRARLREAPEAVRWQTLYDVTDEEGQVVDRLSTCADEQLSSGGYRLLWYRSTKKIALDRAARTRRLQRASAALTELQERLAGPRTRFREQTKVQQAVDEILTQYAAAALIRVHLEEQQETTYRQAQPGRPSKHTKYKKETRPRYQITWDFDAAALAQEERDDGVFPLLTNDHDLTAAQVLQAYKRQPLIEKRFSQFKTDFAVAPVYLKNVARIQGLLTVYFFVLLVQTLLERELRRAMEREQIASLPLYPEGRPCKRPTTRRILDVFEPVQRHVLTLPDSVSAASNDRDASQILVTELTPLQCHIVKLLGLSPESYGR